MNFSRVASSRVNWRHRYCCLKGRTMVDTRTNQRGGRNSPHGRHPRTSATSRQAVAYTVPLRGSAVVRSRLSHEAGSRNPNSATRFALTGTIVVVARSRAWLGGSTMRLNHDPTGTSTRVFRCRSPILSRPPLLRVPMKFVP